MPVEAQELMNIICDQRNQALNAIAELQAELNSLKRELEKPKKKTKIPQQIAKSKETI